MKCRNCGNVMPDDAKYCDRCGEKLRRKGNSRYEYDYDDYDDDYEYEMRRYDNQRRHSSGGGKVGSAILIFLTVVAVCVTVLLALNMYLPSKNKSEDSSNVANQQQVQDYSNESSQKQSSQNETVENNSNQPVRNSANYYYAADYYYSNYNDSYAYLFPESNSRYIDPEELSGCTDSQLAYIRNEIFARHGYIFKTDKYNDYFGSKSWYSPNAYATDNVNNLNAYEKYNVELIKRYE